MCLQVPGRVISIDRSKAVVDYDIEKRIAYISEIRPMVGEYVIVMGKFIVDIVPEDSARNSLELWKRTMLD